MAALGGPSSRLGPLETPRRWRRPILVLALTMVAVTVTVWFAAYGDVVFGSLRQLRRVVKPQQYKSLDECHAATVAATGHTGYEVVKFGPVSVAVPSSEPLGEKFWACTALSEVLQRSCPGCTLVELGGPGACAFQTAKLFPGSRVVLHPGPGPGPEAAAARGGGDQHYLNRSIHVSQHKAPSPPYGTLVEISSRLNRRTVCINCPLAGVETPAGKTVLLLSTCPGYPSLAMEPVMQLLHSGSEPLHALVLLLPAGAHPAARQQAVDLVQAAVAAGMQGPFQGGFDGPAIRDPAALLLAAAAGGVDRSVSLYMLAGGSPRPPPPTVHVFTGLHPLHEGLRAKYTSMLCRHLLATALARNMSVHVVGLAVPSRVLGRPRFPALKLAALRHALRSPAVRPNDVVMLADAADSLAQMSTPALLQRYMDTGAPVFAVATEANCWPISMQPWCGRFEGTTDMPNKWLNGGGFIGRGAVVAKYVEDAVELLMSGAVSDRSWMPRTCACQPPDDQGAISCAYLVDNRYSITPDVRADFFYSVFLVADYLVRERDHWVYNLTATTPAMLHGNSDYGKERLEMLRAAIVPEDYVPAPEARFLLDGKWAMYGEVCRGTVPRPAPNSATGAARASDRT